VPIDSDLRIERVIYFLAQATAGQWDERIPLDDEGSARLLELEYGVNMLLDELAQTRASSESRQREIEQQAAQLAEHQQEMLRLLSTPVISVWPGVLALPIIGEVGPERAATMTESVLDRVVSERATHFILDLTGMMAVGPDTARSLLRMAQAVRLLGARCLLTGIGPQLASALVGLTFELSDLTALPTLADAIAHVFQERGVHLVSHKK
jgi:rsbT co-antagonist protein RsbR